MSNADYARFVAATGHAAPQHWVDGQSRPELAQHPVVFVTSKDACASWAGKQVPTAQQWEKAARGTRRNVFPWGDQRTPAKCNVQENGVGATTPVGRYQSGVSPYGVYDLCGRIDSRSPGAEGRGVDEPVRPVRAAVVQRRGRATMCDDDTGLRCAVPADELRKLLGH
ncbi:formylglycine-generating enzyme family protein [Saccharopolyspora cebuensis]|uniref:Formylglycine-generating enzyme family protein n=1 Tax=Saccharopolyspora cebuensis TaxID=418759 RepID=A0ABV4CQR7_9PSEU